MMGCSVVPMKYATKWKWENIWLIFIGLGQVVFPLILVLVTVPRSWHIYAGVRFSSLLIAILFGIGWGIGNALAGIGYTMLGVGLGMSLVLGLTAASGSLVPLAVFFPGRLITSSALGLYAGVLVMVGGLVLSSQAGRLRQAGQRKDEISAVADLSAFGKGKFRTGLIVCIVAGILSSMLNLAFVFADSIRVLALMAGASASAAVNTLWLPILIAGFLPTLAYCSYLLTENRSWSGFLAPGTGSHWMIAVLMGLLYLGGLSLYGIGAVKLGEMGAVLGFPIFMSTIVLTGNLAGVLTGEWRTSQHRAYRYGVCGMLLLIASIVIIGLASHSDNKPVESRKLRGSALRHEHPNTPGAYLAATRTWADAKS